MNETIQSLFEDLLIPLDYKSETLTTIENSESRYLKDLKLNLSTVLKKSKHLQPKEAYLLALAGAANERSAILIQSFNELALQEGATEEEIAEILACTSLMNSNNIFYRFKHYFPKNEYYNNTPAGFRMSIMMNPILGKEFFELVSFAISVMNNCEMCIQSHETSVKNQGASEGRIYDTVRLVATIKSLVVML